MGMLMKRLNAVTFDAEYKYLESHLTTSSYHFESWQRHADSVPRSVLREYMGSDNRGPQ